MRGTLRSLVIYMDLLHAIHMTMPSHQILGSVSVEFELWNLADVQKESHMTSSIILTMTAYCRTFQNQIKKNNETFPR